MNTSIVIPLGNGSRWGNTELKFALRSVCKHLSGVGDVFIIGEYPRWLQNVIHIPATDVEQTWAKERNIFNKIMLACEDPRVSSSFLFCNDDHFLLQDCVAGEFPFYFDGLLKDKMTITQYKNSVANTIDFFRTEALQFDHWEDTRYYDIHCPIVYNKRLFVTLTKYWQYVIDKPFGGCLKTLYCNNNRYWSEGGMELDDPQLPDLKINQPLPYAEIIKLISGRPWFSIGDAARQGGMLQVLEDLYSVKSKYEK